MWFRLSNHVVLAPITAKISIHMRLKRFSSCGLSRFDAITDCETLVREGIANLDAPIFQIEMKNLMNYSESASSTLSIEASRKQ